MIVVFEGIDYSGKTTLINEMCKMPDYEICHHLKPDKVFKTEEQHHQLIDFKAHVEYQIINQLHKFISKKVIFDRFIISNIAYLNFYKRQYDISYMKSEHWDNLKIIYINIQKETIEERMKHREDFLDLNVDKLISLREHYENALIEFDHSFLKINAETNIKANIELIKSYIGN